MTVVLKTAGKNADIFEAGLAYKKDMLPSNDANAMVSCSDDTVHFECLGIRF